MDQEELKRLIMQAEEWRMNRYRTRLAELQLQLESYRPNQVPQELLNEIGLLLDKLDLE